MKNLSNCKPSEFLRQTARIRKSVAKWLEVTDLMNIRKNVPELEHIDIDMTVEEKAKIQARNDEAILAQGRENAMRILEAVLEDHPDETLEVLALCCFVEPEHVDDHTVGEYLTAFTELLNDSTVTGFFISLARLANLNI